MNVSEILDAIGGEIVARNCFLVDLSVSKDNDIVLTIESENGKIELEDCVSLSRFFESKFDREVEDYSLTVSSAGLDQPFKVMNVNGDMIIVEGDFISEENGHTIHIEKSYLTFAGDMVKFSQTDPTAE